MYFVQDSQPIHIAAANGHVNIVQLLIDAYGIDPTVKTGVRMSIVMYACMYTLMYVCTWISRNTDLKYLNHHSFLMLDNSHL